MTPRRTIAYPIKDVYWRLRAFIRRFSKDILIVGYEAIVLVLLVASTGWTFDRVETETVVLVVLLPVPVLLPQVSQLSLPFFGGSATIQFREIQARVKNQAERLEAISNSTEMAINSLTAYLQAPPLSAQSVGQYVRERVDRQRIIVVGCQVSTNQRLLCAMVSQLINERKVFDKVIPKYDYGGAALNFISLLKGQIDIFPCYTWTGFEMSIGPSLRHIRHNDRPLQELSPEDAIEELNKIYGEPPHSLTWLPHLGYENNWEMVMMREEAQRRGIARTDEESGKEIGKLSDLKRWNGQLTLGCERDFFEREAGYSTLHLPSGYGLRFREIRFYRHTQVYEALTNGEVDIIDGYTIDPDIDSHQFLRLRDDLRLFGRYYPVPVVRSELVGDDDRYGIRKALSALKIDDGEIRRMIRDADRVKEGPHLDAVEWTASKFLKNKGLLRS